jgi:hypothetical protein
MGYDADRIADEGFVGVTPRLRNSKIQLNSKGRPFPIPKAVF